MLVVGVSAILIPLANTVSQLIIPHLGLGLGIGIVDAALVPLLASLVEPNDNYGPVYSIQQVAVSLAYSLGKNVQNVSNEKIKITQDADYTPML